MFYNVSCFISRLSINISLIISRVHFLNKNELINNQFLLGLKNRERKKVKELKIIDIKLKYLLFTECKTLIILFVLIKLILIILVVNIVFKDIGQAIILFDLSFVH